MELHREMHKDLPKSSDQAALMEVTTEIRVSRTARKMVGWRGSGRVETGIRREVLGWLRRGQVRTIRTRLARRTTPAQSDVAVPDERSLLLSDSHICRLPMVECHETATIPRADLDRGDSAELLERGT